MCRDGESRRGENTQRDSNSAEILESITAVPSAFGGKSTYRLALTLT